MSPDQSLTKRRVVVLPLPVWIGWWVVVGLYRGFQLTRAAVSKYRAAHQAAPAFQLAVQHQDRRCRQVAERLFEHLNAYRAENGLRPLRWNGRLESSSLYQSTRMSELSEFAHVLSDGVDLSERVTRFGYRYRSCGENLFWMLDRSKGVGGIAWTMHDGWVHSPGHQANLVGDWKEVGIGVVPDGEGGYYATQNFARPRTPF